jgi:hypothetical protein
MEPSYMSPFELSLTKCPALFDFLKLTDATILRATSSTALAEVAKFKWVDSEEILQSPWAWKRSFPFAMKIRTRSATRDWLPQFAGVPEVFLRASPLKSIRDEDFEYFAGASSVSLRFCNLPRSLTFAGFTTLARGGHLRILDVGHNDGLYITDAILRALTGISELCIEKTDASAVTVAGWAALAGISELHAYGSRLQVTDAAMKALVSGGCSDAIPAVSSMVRGCIQQRLVCN